MDQSGTLHGGQKGIREIGLHTPDESSQKSGQNVSASAFGQGGRADGVQCPQLSTCHKAARTFQEHMAAKG